MEIKEPEVLNEGVAELASPPSEELEELLEKLNKESNSNKLRTEELYKEYLEKYNNQLQVRRIYFRVNKALKSLQSIDETFAGLLLDENEFNNMYKDIEVVEKYAKKNPEAEDIDMINMLVIQAKACLEIQKGLETDMIDLPTMKSLNNLLDDIADKELRENYEKRIDEAYSNYMEEEMKEANKENDNEESEKEESEEKGSEEEIKKEENSESYEESNQNEKRFFKIPTKITEKIKHAWIGINEMLASKVEFLEKNANNKNISLESLTKDYEEAKELLDKYTGKGFDNYKKRLDKVKETIDKRKKAEAEKASTEKTAEKETAEKEISEKEAAEKAKKQFNKIMDNVRKNPTEQNISFARKYIEDNKNNKNLFENEEQINSYLNELDNYVIQTIENKVESAEKTTIYENIVIAEKIIKENKNILTNKKLYQQYLDRVNKCILKYIGKKLDRIKQTPKMEDIKKLESFINNRKDNFENKTVLDKCLETLKEEKNKLNQKEIAKKAATNLKNKVFESIENAKKNPTKENIDKAKTLIEENKYNKNIFGSIFEANNYLKIMDELNREIFKQMTEGSSSNYSDLNKFISTKEGQINKLRDKEQELRGKLIDLERQTFIHPELKLEKMAPIKRELEVIRKDIEYYTKQLNNSRKVLENRKHANTQSHYDSLFNQDLGSLTNEEIQKASSEKVDMDELKKYAQLKEKLNPIKVEPITKKDVGELAADNFNASLSSAMKIRLTDVNEAERLIEDAEKVFWANRSNYPVERIDELQNNLEVAISTIKNQKYQNTNGRTL